MEHARGGSLIRDRWLTGAALASVCLLSWAWIVPMAHDMQGAMTGSSAWMMKGPHDLTYAFGLLAMWVVMMTGMMLPSAAPTILLYARVARSDASIRRPAARAQAFLAGYLLAWSLFSVAATGLQLAFAHSAIITPMLAFNDRRVAAASLLLAGVYQFLSIKQRCLVICRSPAVFISQNWRPGASGALKMGFHHGLICLGCCWALMLLLFAGGVMNLVTIALLTALVLLEKLMPAADWVRVAAGLALVGLALYLLLASELPWQL